MKNTKEQNTLDETPVAQDENRREMLKKLGKYGKTSAVVTAVVYSGIQSKAASAGLPPIPPIPSL